MELAKTLAKRQRYNVACETSRTAYVVTQRAMHARRPAARRALGGPLSTARARPYRPNTRTRRHNRNTTLSPTNATQFPTQPFTSQTKQAQTISNPIKLATRTAVV